MMNKWSYIQYIVQLPRDLIFSSIGIYKSCYHFVRAILSVPFCPCHFVQYHFVRSPFCELDPLPPFVIADRLDDLTPFFLYLFFNRSLAEGCIPDSQKRALVFPALKKPTLDPNLCKNYRPISNLSFLSQRLLNASCLIRFILT